MDDTLGTDPEIQPPKYKRKKRKTPLRQAKKYANRGISCQGSRISEDTFKYLLRVFEISNTKFETPEEQDMFVNNSFEQMVDEEINYSSNQLGCRIIEKLLPLASDAIVMRFIDIFGKDLRPLVTDPFASHVLQKLVVLAGERGSLVNTDAKFGEAYDQWLLKCSNFVMNNLEDFVWDKYANHVIRSCLEALAGFKEKEAQNLTNTHKTGKNVTESDPETKRNIPPAFKDVILELARRLMLWPQFAQLAYEEKPCGLLYTLLIVLKATSKKPTSCLVKKLLEECFRTKKAEEDDDEKKEEKEKKGSSTTLPDVFMNPLTSRLLDAAIMVATPKTFTKIYADLFLNNLGKLAVLPTANHQVQKLFDQSTEKLEFESMYDEIAPFFEEIFSCKYYGVFVSIAKACKRHSTKEQFFIREMMKVLHCSEPMERQLQIVPLILNLTTFEQKEPIENVSLHGSVILQTLLTFSKPIKIVDSLLALSTDELITVFTHMRGSYILDVYMVSKTIGEKSREKMFRKLKGNYLKLTCSKHGSRAVDGLWAGLNLGQKSALLTELGPKEAILNSHEFGRIIAAKYKLSLFNYRKDDWMRSQEDSNKKRKLFEDIIGDLGKKKKVTDDK